MSGSIRVLIVDDSAFMRVTIAKHLENDPAIRVVGGARDGMEALEQLARLRPDVLTLDIEMPRMDGLETLRRIMAECPTPVIMLSSRTQRGARVTIQALMRGAVDFVAKPDGAADTRTVMAELIDKIKIATVTRPPSIRPREPSFAPTHPANPRPLQPGDPLIVLGASTGGPHAIEQIIADLPADLPAAIAIVQHMPAGFTRSLALRLNELYPLEIREAADGDQLARGRALIAPGDYHLRFGRLGCVTLDREARRNYVRPSLDVALESAAARYGPSVIGVVLTGMGEDGTEGARQVKAAGGCILAEHESSSVVYGMPRSVIEAGLADRVVALPDLAAQLTRMVGHGSLGV
jgi:two-component system chemotaxis response regulator CheB